MTTYRIHDTPKGGFFSDFRATLSAVGELKKQGHKCNIHWSNYLFQSEAKENIWEVFFHQIDEIDEGAEVLDIRGNPLPREYSTRTTIHDTIQKYVRVKKNIQEEVDSFIEKNFTKNTVGVHLRLTDKAVCHIKYGEPETGTPVELELYKNHIEEYLNSNEDSSVFLATDSKVGLNFMKSAFGDRVHFIEDIIRSDGDESVHVDMGGNGIQKAKDVLMDCLLLSRCNYVIKGISNVALCALFFNKDLKSFNLNSHYKNDTREDFVNG